MSVVTSVNCPLCGGKGNMMEDYFFKMGEVFYHCHSCGYGNLFKIKEKCGDKYWTWDGRCEKRRFLKKVNVKKEHGLMFSGEVPFYPIEVEFPEYKVCPRPKRGKLIWKLYSADKKFLGEYKSLGDAFGVGDENND